MDKRNVFSNAVSSPDSAKYTCISMQSMQYFINNHATIFLQRD